MLLSTIDWIIIATFFMVSLAIGLWTARSAGKSVDDFFLSGRNMPWWLLGISMVATTFSADTPNLVTDIVRTHGVSGNWVWWAFLLTGMLTVFVYAKLWRRSEVLTDLEFYELRYSGKGAAFLRGFRALYLGVFFNIMIMATVCLAGIKIGGVLLGFSPLQTLFLAATVTVVYSSLGGLKGVIITDFFQFILAMAATIGAAVVLLDLPEVGGLEGLINHVDVVPKLDLIPDITSGEVFLTLFIIPIALQWWSVWYPGAEPGGGGYIAQRMLSAKDEKNAIWATLLFNFMHYAVRPWPWILVALASVIVFPTLDSLQAAFPNLDPSVIGHDLAYPAMMSFLPSGLLGLLLASLIAAFMSTLSSHLNWGSSYVVHDFYRRFVEPEATQKKLVAVGRITTVVLMVLAGLLALALQNALQAFSILLQIGAGTGLLFILRWFWWRINIYSEITAMVVSFVIALYMELLHPALGGTPLDGTTQLLLGVGITTICWVGVTLLTHPEDEDVLYSFIEKINPGGPGWKSVHERAAASGKKLTISKQAWNVPTGILCMLFGSLMIYSLMFSTGYFLYGDHSLALQVGGLALLSFGGLFYFWKKLRTSEG
ncbi:MAG: Sodium/glucose cotransporter [Flavobacteriaceae bacterium]|nr:MAG: Sodium/glucose cotransporter [Flavobacteriaceae bacterium]|tara:strand:+ start:1179 stop:2975 length:1797 start_codon:yes stop_codon:yes gene_type:complete